MAAKAIEYSGGGLTKRHTRNGWRWAGQVRWRYAGEKKWRTKLKVLETEDGKPIKTDPRKVDPNETDPKKRGKDVNMRGHKTAQKAYVAWLQTLERVRYDNQQDVRTYLLEYIESLRKKNSAIAEQNARARRNGEQERPLPYSNGTLRGYSEYVPIIAEGLADIPMASLSSTDVYRWIQSMSARGLAPATIRKAFSILSVTCDHAVLMGHMPTSPCVSSIRKRIEDTPTAEPNHLSLDGIVRVNQLLNDAKNPRLRIGARIALACGLRAGEVCALRWRDIDGEVLHVTSTIINRGGGCEEKAPKSFAGTRTVDIPPALARELTDWCMVQAAAWNRFWTGKDGTVGDQAVPFADCRVLGYETGEWFTPHALSVLWGRLAKGVHEKDPNDRRRYSDVWVPGHEPIVGATGVRIRLHDLRHSYATVLVAKGVNIAEVSRLMGHADSAVTLRRYSGRFRDLSKLTDMDVAGILTSGSAWAACSTAGAADSSEES